MTNNEIITLMYDEDKIRDLKFMKTHLHHGFQLTWHSSHGVFNWKKDDALSFIEEISNNFINSKFDIQYFFEQDDKIALHYSYFAASFENPNDLILIGKFASVWEFKDNKLFNCYQISQTN